MIDPLSGFTPTAFFEFVGGFILFLVGIQRISEGLQRIAGGRIRPFFAGFIKNRVKGSIFGLFVASLTQSSTATAVLTIGFVNAGIITLVDGIAVLLGANVGVSLLLQIATLNPGWLLLPFMLLGLLLRYAARKPHWRHSGEVFFGLSLLMLGLTLMTAAFEPLRANHWMRHLLASVDDNLWLSVLTSALLAACVQSSTAVIALIIVLCSSGLLPFPAGVALILGANIGACAPTLIAAAQSSLAARRVAIAQIMITVATITLIFLLFPFFLQVLGFISPGEADFVIETPAQMAWYRALPGEKPFVARYLANANTLYAFLSALIFLPLLKPVARLTTLLLRGSDAVQEFGLKYIDYRVLNTPPVALGQARSELRRMARTAQAALAETILYLDDLNDERLSRLNRREHLLDLLQKELTNFLVELSHRSASAETAREVALMMHMVADFERIGDHCQSLIRLAGRKREWQAVFSGSAERELGEISAQTAAFLQIVVEALETGDSSGLAEAQHRENEIDLTEERLRNNHLRRLTTGECAVRPGLIFIDMLQAFEQISDHTYSIAKCIDGAKR